MIVQFDDPSTWVSVTIVEKQNMLTKPCHMQVCLNQLTTQPLKKKRVHLIERNNVRRRHQVYKCITHIALILHTQKEATVDFQFSVDVHKKHNSLWRIITLKSIGKYRKS